MPMGNWCLGEGHLDEAVGAVGEEGVVDAGPLEGAHGLRAVLPARRARRAQDGLQHRQLPVHARHAARVDHLPGAQGAQRSEGWARGRPNAACGGRTLCLLDDDSRFSSS